MVLQNVRVASIAMSHPGVLFSSIVFMYIAYKSNRLVSVREIVFFYSSDGCKQHRVLYEVDVYYLCIYIKSTT